MGLFSKKSETQKLVEELNSSVPEGMAERAAEALKKHGSVDGIRESVAETDPLVGALSELVAHAISGMHAHYKAGLNAQMVAIGCTIKTDEIAKKIRAMSRAELNKGSDKKVKNGSKRNS